MNVEAIGLSALDTATAASPGSKAEQGGFSDWLKNEMTDLNNQISHAESQVQDLALGKQDNLHQVMISLEKAKLSFELGLQVRNKMLEGFQEIMRMQV